MIAEFIESWPLFYRTYLSAIMIGLSLSLLGVVVVARGNVFVAAAISQASLLGVALSMFFRLGQPVLAAVFCSVGASLLVARKHSAGGSSSSEELTGWLFLISGSLSVLLLAKMPFGLKEIQSLFFFKYYRSKFAGYRSICFNAGDFYLISAYTHAPAHTVSL